MQLGQHSSGARPIEQQTQGKEFGSQLNGNPQATQAEPASQ
jgi:hypothetical protein